MYDLSDVTFGIPLRITNKDRLENLDKLLKYLNENYQTNIMIIEEDKKSKISNEIKEKYNNVDFRFLYCESEFFNRTSVINYGIMNCKTKIYANSDVDIVGISEAYFMASDLIRRDEYNFILPYNGPVYEINNINDIIDYNKKKLPVAWKIAIGGVIFFNNEVYKSIGMENENIFSWGYEDSERYSRIQKFGHEIKRLDYSLFHFKHNRDKNSRNNPYAEKNKAEFHKVDNMNKEQIINYMKNWKYLYEE